MAAGTEWTPFLATSAGALSALAGLILVGLSINLRVILEIPGLQLRGMEALGLLVGSMLLCLLALVPGQAPELFAAECLTTGILLTIVTWLATWAMLPVARSYPVVFGLKLVLGIASLPPYFLTATGNPGWLAAAVVISVISASVSAWVLLVEINKDRGDVGGATAPEIRAATSSRTRSR